MYRQSENSDSRLGSAALKKAWRVGMLIAGLTIHAAPVAAAQEGGGAPGPAPAVDDPRLDESSGLAISRRSPDRFWTHNDSGDAPRLFTIDGPARRVGVVEVVGAEAEDWEDMASMEIDGQPMLLVADVGDNGRRRDSVDLYLIAEPTLESGMDGRVEVRRRIRVRYPDGPLDCEAIAFDASGSRVIMIAKGRLPWAGVYAIDLDDHPVAYNPSERAPDDTASSAAIRRAPRPAADAQLARRLGTIGVPMATSMDIRADGLQMAVASYLDLFLFDRQAEESWEEALRRTPQHIRMPPLKQIEAVCYDQQGALWVTSEGDPMPLVRVETRPKGTE